VKVAIQPEVKGSHKQGNFYSKKIIVNIAEPLKQREGEEKKHRKDVGKRMEAKRDRDIAMVASPLEKRGVEKKKRAPVGKRPGKIKLFRQPKGSTGKN
jgi:hypothetical protein